jgi:hypothetical protein
MAENIIIPRRRADFFDDRGEPTYRYIKWVELVTGQTNDTSVIVEDTEQGLTSTSSRVSRNAARINSIELKEFEIINTTVSVTTEEFQIIICKNTSSITVTLDPQAVENDEVHIKRRGGSINVIGSIDGLTNKTINILNYSMHLVFDGTDWSEI